MKISSLLREPSGYFKVAVQLRFVALFVCFFYEWINLSLTQKYAERSAVSKLILNL
jgi:hypothetical protein